MRGLQNKLGCLFQKMKRRVEIRGRNRAGIIERDFCSLSY